MPATVPTTDVTVSFVLDALVPCLSRSFSREEIRGWMPDGLRQQQRILPRLPAGHGADAGDHHPAYRTVGVALILDADETYPEVIELL
jgi:hypothetical protein